MSLPKNWFDLVDHSREAIQYHESWVIVKICSDDGGKTIQPMCNDQIKEGYLCYPTILLCKPTHREISGKSAFAGGQPQEGDVFKGTFGCYKVVHIWNNWIEYWYEMYAFASSEQDRLRIKETMLKNKEEAEL